MFIVQGLAFALALAGFLMAVAVENRFQSFSRRPKDTLEIAPVSATIAAE
ncbi:MAG TPA: hypothetical protein VMD53_20025 [Rhizomicrobium sp.]|nr:hypothetical protein [Rhizomicrobium sp.]